MRAVPRLCWFYPGICLTTEEKARTEEKLLLLCNLSSCFIAKLLRKRSKTQLIGVR
jgi:hypothetical protein